MKTQLLGAAIAVLLAGCATNNIPGVASYSAVAPSAYVGIAPTSKSAEPFTVIAKRDPGKLGVMLASMLTVDGKSIAPIKPGEYVELKLDPGEYLFGVAWTDGLGKVATGSTREVAIDGKPGKTYFLRMFPQNHNGIVIERSSQ